MIKHSPLSKHEVCESIQVMIRVRKLPENESQRMNGPALIIDNTQIRIEYSSEMKSQIYSFDRVASQDKGQDYIFQQVGIPVAQCCIKGYNSCIFAYGQTGAGKTFTMTGTQNDPGLQQRVLSYLFEQLERKVEEQELESFKVNVSCYEIYNEQINDLITNRKDIKIRENLDGPFIENLTTMQVVSLAEAQHWFTISTKNRSIAATLMNKQSSRSHSIFSVTMVMTKFGNQGELSSKLNFVDMAGSERQKKTLSEGQRLKEAGSINKSLFEFSKVIGDLAKSRGNVVFRNSKLTHALKECLVGNSKTFIICAVSPSSLHLDETENTLKFASNAKFIETKPFTNSFCPKNINDELQKQLKEAETIIKHQQERIEEKDSLIDQLKLHVDSQDEQMKQQIEYYSGQLEDVENEKIKLIKEIEQQLLDKDQQITRMEEIQFETEVRLKGLKDLNEQQGERMKKLLEEKRILEENLKQAEMKNIQVQALEEKSLNTQQIKSLNETPGNCFEVTPTPNESNVISNKSKGDEASIKCEENTPTPTESFQSNIKTDQNIENKIMELEVEVSILREQNIYNKQIHKQLEQINSQLMSQNKEMNMTSSVLIREKESLISEMNRINQNFGQKSQMLSYELESYKDQLKQAQQKLESFSKESHSSKEELNFLQQDNQQLQQKVSYYEQQESVALTEEEKDKKLAQYLQQIKTLASELKKRAEEAERVEEEKRQIQEQKALIISKSEKLNKISNSIIQGRLNIKEVHDLFFNFNSEIDSECSISSDINNSKQKSILQIKNYQNESLNEQINSESNSMQEISHKEYNQNLKKILQQKCQELNEVVVEDIPSLETNSHKQISKRKSKHSNKNRHIQEQLEIFFIENPDFYVNKKRLSNLENFAKFVFSQLIDNHDQQESSKIKEIINQGSFDQLCQVFQQAITKKEQLLFNKSNSLMECVMTTLRTHKVDQDFSQDLENKYAEQIELFAQANQPQKIRALIFDEYNSLNLRKSKRSPYKISGGRQALSDKSMTFINLNGDSSKVEAEEFKTIYDNWSGRKKLKSNNEQF